MEGFKQFKDLKEFRQTIERGVIDYNIDTGETRTFSMPSGFDIETEIKNKGFGPYAKRYLDNFITDGSNIQKRFGRYVQKVTFMLGDFIDREYSLSNYMQLSTSTKKAVSYEDKIAKLFRICISRYTGKEDMDADESKVIAMFDHLVKDRYVMPSFIRYVDDEKVLNAAVHVLFSEDPEKPDNMNIINWTEQAVLRSCEEYLKYRYLMDDTIDESNFANRALPNTDADIQMILVDVIDRLFVSADRIVMALTENGKAKNAKKWDDKAKKDIEALNETIRDLKKDLKEAKHEIKVRTDKQKRAEETLAECQEENRSLVKKALNKDRQDNEKADLLARIKELEKDNRLLRDAVAEQGDKENGPEEPAKQQEKVARIDKSKNYVFAIDFYYASNVKRYTDYFPNMTIVKGNDTINVKKADMLIMMTSFVNHATSDYMKAQCRTHGIPVVNTAGSSVKAVCSAIATNEDFVLKD